MWPNYQYPNLSGPYASNTMPNEPAPILVSATIAMGTPYVVLTFDRAVTWPGTTPAGFYFQYEGDYWWADPPGGASGGEITGATGKDTSIVTLTLNYSPNDPGIIPYIGYIGGPGSLTGNVTNTAGTALAQFAETVVTNITPFADFTGTPTSGTTPVSVTFSNTTNDKPNVSSWLWEKSDGGGWVNFVGTPTAENPTEVFTTGTWSVRLTTTAGGGIPSTQKTRTNYIAVSAPPAITLSSATATPDTGPGTITLVFSGNADNHDGFTFRIGGGSNFSMQYLSGDGTNTLVFNNGGTWISSDTVYVSYSPGNVTGLDPFIDSVVTIVP